jgi:hypothetical protein
VSELERRWAIAEPPTLPFEAGSCPVRLLNPISGMAVYEREVEVVDAATFDELRAENERLRALIGRAPHARHCEAGASLFPGACSCWKKDAATVPELVERSRALGPVMEAQGERVAQGLREAADRMRGGE